MHFFKLIVSSAHY